MKQEKVIIGNIEKILKSKLSYEDKLDHIVYIATDLSDAKHKVNSQGEAIAEHLVKRLMWPSEPHNWEKDIAHKMLGVIINVDIKINKRGHITPEQLNQWLLQSCNTERKARGAIRIALRQMDKKPETSINSEQVLTLWTKFIKEVVKAYVPDVDYTEDQVKTFISNILGE